MAILIFRSIPVQSDGTYLENDIQHAVSMLVPFHLNNHGTAVTTQMKYQVSFLAYSITNAEVDKCQKALKQKIDSMTMAERNINRHNAEYKTVLLAELLDRALSSVRTKLIAPYISSKNPDEKMATRAWESIVNREDLGPDQLEILILSKLNPAVVGRLHEAPAFYGISAYALANYVNAAVPGTGGDFDAAAIGTALDWIIPWVSANTVRKPIINHKFHLFTYIKEMKTDLVAALESGYDARAKELEAFISELDKVVTSLDRDLLEYMKKEKDQVSQREAARLAAKRANAASQGNTTNKS